MIPKIIHYCWFGRGKMPDLAIKCVESWKKVLPEYELRLWNEDNFDLDLYPYVREAYDNRKFAFVTDVVRLWALEKFGGVYMDTDVEILKSLDPFLHHTAFSGFESPQSVPTGLMASEKGSVWARDMLNYYKGKHFINEDGSFDYTTNCDTITKLLLPKGLILNDTYQDFEHYFTLYPHDYFCPCNWKTMIITKTDNTVCIHHFLGSWHSIEAQKKSNEIRFRRTYPFWGTLIYSPKIIYRKIQKLLNIPQ